MNGARPSPGLPTTLHTPPLKASCLVKGNTGRMIMGAPLTLQQMRLCDERRGYRRRYSDGGATRHRGPLVALNNYES